MKKIVLNISLGILFCFLLPKLSVAQPGALDPTFNPANGIFTPPATVNGQNLFNYGASVQQPDDKTIFYYNLPTYNGAAISTNIIRITKNAALDNTFNTGTGVAGGSIKAISLQVDGKVLIGGDFTSFNGSPHVGIVRLNADGSLDNSFSTGTGLTVTDGLGVPPVINAFAIQPDGKIIAVGWFSNYKGTVCKSIVRLNTDGSVDNTFNSTSLTFFTGVIYVDGGIESCALQSTGKIIVGGINSDGDPTSAYAMRLNSDGSVDNSFTSISQAYKVLVQSDDKIVTYVPLITMNNVKRFNANGTADATFNIGSSAFHNNIFKLQADGKILIAGSVAQYTDGQTTVDVSNSGMLRLQANGLIDNGFTSLISGVSSSNSNRVCFIEFTQANKLITGYKHEASSDFDIKRLNTDGSLDVQTAAGPGGGVFGLVSTTAIQSDGKIIIGGAFSSYNGITRKGIARVNSDGSLDEAYDPSTLLTSPNADYALVLSSAIQPDGKMLFAYHYGYNSNSLPEGNYLVRVNADGSPDAAFNSNSASVTSLNPPFAYNSIAVQPDGKIIVGNTVYVYRLNVDGSLDGSFVGASIAGNDFSEVRAVAIAADGKIMIGGHFNTVNGVTKTGLARLNSDGSLDNSFDAGYATSSFSIRKIIIQGDGKIFAFGKDPITRLNQDGTQDAGFTTFPNLFPDLSNAGGIIQADGKIIVAVTTLANQYLHLKRLNPDGTLDESFNPNSSEIAIHNNGTDGLYSMSSQSDGKIILGGSFGYDGTLINNIARILPGCLGSTLPTISATSTNITYPQSTTLSIATGNLNNATTWKWYSNSCGGTLVGTGTSITVSPNRTTTYYVRGEGGCVLEGACASITINVQSQRYYIHNGNPWATTDNQTAMNNVFATGNWMDTPFTTDPATIFTSATSFIMIEGSNGQEQNFSSYLSANMTLIENWVSNGGRLFINSAPNVLIDINCGFNGTQINFNAGSGSHPVHSAHITDTIFKGPFTPVATAFIGLSASHGSINGNDLNKLLISDDDQSGIDVSCLSYKQLGTGFAFFGSLTPPTLTWSPQPQANNFWYNLFDYVNSVNTDCILPTVPTISATSTNITFPQSTTLSIATGNLNNATNWKWYSNSCGGTLVGTGNSITVSPNRTTTYYVRGEGGCAAAGACASITITVQAGRYYIRDSDPYGVMDNQAAMNNVFGAGNWTEAHFATNPASIFTTTTSFVMMDAWIGIDSLETYLSINNSLIENWVLNGGRILINSNLLGSFNSDMNCGFNNTLIRLNGTSNSLTAVAANINDTIFKGPYVPVTTSFNGNSASHTVIIGSGLDTLVKGENGKPSLAFKQWGNGFAFFGGFTPPTYTWTPQPQAINFWYNLFDYVNSVSPVPQYILVGQLSSTSLCAGSNFSIPYTASGFIAGNIFTTQLSDATGSFANPVTIGTINSNASGTINVTIPANTVAGTGYRIRIKASLPNNTSADNGANLTINTPVTPSVSIALTNGSIPFCSGQPLTFTATPVNGGSNPIYQWKLNGNTNIGTNSPVLIYNNFANGDVLKCTLTSNALCSTQATAVSNGITLTISEPFTPDIFVRIVDQTGSYSYYATALSTCAAATVSFVTASNYAGSNPHYQWKLNGNNVGTDSPNYTKTGFNNNDVITCELTSDVPCTMTTTVSSQAITVSTYSISSASVSINASDTYCAGTTAEFDAYVQNAGPQPAYQWKKNGINVGTNISYYLDDALVTGDVITCSITTDPVCETPITVQSSNSITVTVYQPVTPTVSIAAGNPLSSLANIFTASITNGGANPTYEWKKNAVVVGNNSNTYIDLSLISGDVIACTLNSDAPCATVSIVISNSITVQTLSYCIPHSIYAATPCTVSGWITNVLLGTTINQSSVCGGFYEDYTATDTLKTTAGQTIDFTITEGSDGTNWGMNANIYIDYNRDGDFTDAGEKVADNIFMSVSDPASNSFVLSALLGPGSYRIRVMLSNNSVSTPCELDYGEAEDYILQITQPDYCIPVISNPCDMWISNVIIGSINNSSTQSLSCDAGGYTNYSSLLSTTVSAGQSVNYTLSALGNYYQYGDIYADYNSDGDFDDEGEHAASDIFMDYSGTPATGSFIVPSLQAYGLYRMRVKSHSTQEPQTGPCGNNSNGETEDYTLIITCIPNGSDIVVKGNDVVINDGDNTPDIADFTDFGNVIFNTSFTRTFFIENPGTNTLHISGVTIAGQNPSYFTVVNQPATSIVAGGSTSFTIQFNPGYFSVFSAVMHINNDNCDKKDYDINIFGTGVCPPGGPDINVQGNGIDIPIYDYSPNVADNTDFGTVTSNNTLSKTFTIQNIGNQPLNIAGAEAGLFNEPNQFVVTSQPAATVAPGGFTTFTVKFSPGGSGQRDSWIRILNNDCDESYYPFLVTGSAECPSATPEINIKGNSIAITDGDDTPDATDNTDFGTTPINTSISKTFTIENTGADPLTISGIIFTGINAADFSVTTAPAATVAPGNSTTFTIQLLPTTGGPKFATMHINNNDCDEGNYDFALKGNDNPCVPPAAVAGSDRTTCAGVSTTIGAALVPGSEYSWTSLPAGFTSTLPDPTVNPTVTTTYYITETITATGCTATNSVTVTVNPLPATPTVSLTQPTCDVATGTIIIAAPTGMVSYTVTGTSPVTMPVIQAGLIFPLLTPGIYDITTTNTEGCISTALSVTIKLDKAYWTGTIDDDWNKPGNWSTGQVPTASTHVFIPTGTPTCRVRTADAHAASIQAQNGTTLEVMNDWKIIIHGICATVRLN